MVVVCRLNAQFGETAMADRANPAALTDGPTRRRAIVGVVGALGGLALASSRAWAQAEDGISHTEESIHQEPVFTASPKRVYEALTDPKQFTRVVQLSGALQAMHLADSPAQISKEAGGAFALYGGYITGRHIELVPNVRVVQAWRAGHWPAGVYSIAKFELVQQGSGCKIAFDHTGFPKGDAQNLASGWKAHYWEPLAKVLA
jgi:activator of HSP90 ATPase